MLSAVWLVGILAQTPASIYPTLESIFGDEAKAEPSQEMTEAQARDNAYAWAAVMKAGNKRSGGQQDAAAG